ncbi:MAG: flagellar hook capping protein [Armatimonadetes bacterium]|nr:flagellar hook capping protein [Armatimonadota bacterium]
MEVGAVGNVGNIYASPEKVEPPKQELDKDAFLQILVAQMRYQNPLAPQDSNQFISQVVELTTMEQLFNLSKSMEMLLKAQELSLSAGLVGKQVTVVGPDGQDVRGAVDKVVIGEEGIQLVIDGISYDYGSVKEILG